MIVSGSSAISRQVTSARPSSECSLPGDALPTAAHPARASDWDPDTYQAFAARLAHYAELQETVVEAAKGRDVERILDLGCGTAEASKRLLSIYEDARLTGLDTSQKMLEAAARSLPPERSQLILGSFEDPIPTGPFDVVVSVLAVHHVDSEAKARLFANIAEALVEGGRFVLGDIMKDPIVPTESRSLLSRLRRSLKEKGLAETVGKIRNVARERIAARTDDGRTLDDPLSPDQPDLLVDQLRWLTSAGLEATVVWQKGSMSVVVADKPKASAESLGLRPPSSGIESPGAQPPHAARSAM
jgi:tRNA (cmo5U34)-methyltransferase